MESSELLSILEAQWGGWGCILLWCIVLGCSLYFQAIMEDAGFILYFIRLPLAAFDYHPSKDSILISDH